MKKVYSVSYDLMKSGKDYSGLHGELKQTNEWYHLLGSTWMLYTSESSEQVWERLKPHLDGNDQILIVEVKWNFSGWLTMDAWDWLKNRIPVYS